MFKESGSISKIGGGSSSIQGPGSGGITQGGSGSGYSTHEEWITKGCSGSGAIVQYPSTIIGRGDPCI